METRASTAQEAPPLRTRRQSVGLSIRDLERITGINRGRLSHYERGQIPTADDGALIETALAAANVAPTKCGMCHGLEGAAAPLVIVAGVGPRNICGICAGRLGRLGLEVREDRRAADADDSRYLADNPERRRS